MATPTRDVTRPADTSTGAPTAGVPGPHLLDQVNPTKASLGEDTPTAKRPSTHVENRTTRSLRRRGLIA